MMLDWERWTLTHSSGGAVVPVLVLPLFCGLGLELGLAATRASSAAAVADVADVPDCEGDGEGEDERLGEGDGDGEGVGVADDGSAWHTLFVLADVVLADVVLAGAACAVPSMPRIRKLPLSKVTAATLTCAKRIGIACLGCSSGLPCALRDSEATRGRMGTGTHYR